MHEACIILPVEDNNGLSLASEHKALGRALLEKFGGYSRSECVGSWLDPKTNVVHDDKSYMYTVAMSPTPKNDKALFSIASSTAASCGQEAIYVRDAWGCVHIIHPVNNKAKLAA